MCIYACVFDVCMRVRPMAWELIAGDARAAEMLLPLMRGAACVVVVVSGVMMQRQRACIDTDTNMIDTEREE